MIIAKDFTGLRYHVDASDRIIEVDDDWRAFATSNNGTQLLPPGILGTSLWQWVSDDATCKIYRQIMKQVRRDERGRGFRFRCDAPEQRRLLRMTITPWMSGGLSFETSLVRARDREPMLVLDATVRRSTTLLTICGWCIRIRDSEARWLDVEEAVTVMALFESAMLPAVTHGICPECYDTMLNSLDESSSASSPEPVLGAF